MELLLKNRPYLPPRILRETEFVTECQLLSTSIVDETGVTTMGQKVDDYNWADDTQGFNHEWE